MEMQKVEIEVPEFDGYEFVGYREPEIDEWVLVDGKLSCCNCVGVSARLIYRKIVKYREPTQSDVGKMVEVRDDKLHVWKLRELLGVVNSQSPFICRYDLKNHYSWRYARIIDDGSPTKQPRELWINFYADGCTYTHKSVDGARKARGNTAGETVHFREVL